MVLLGLIALSCAGYIGGGYEGAGGQSHANSNLQSLGGYGHGGYDSGDSGHDSYVSYWRTIVNIN